MRPAIKGNLFHFRIPVFAVIGHAAKTSWMSPINAVK